jgi:hypothetical protein
MHARRRILRRPAPYSPRLACAKVNRVCPQSIAHRQSDDYHSDRNAHIGTSRWMYVDTRYASEVDKQGAIRAKNHLVAVHRSELPAGTLALMSIFFEKCENLVILELKS